MSTSEQTRGTAASGSGGASGAPGERAAAGSPGQPGDLEPPAATPEAADAVRGGMALPMDKQREIARNT